MMQRILTETFLLLNIRLSMGQDCGLNGSCSNLISDYVIKNFKHIENSTECQTLCFKDTDCNFYTYYNRQAVSALSGSCHLFRNCDLQNQCSGCVSGPRDCSATCRVPPVRGEGTWFCNGHNTSVPQGEPIGLNKNCFYKCGAKPLQKVSCISGHWDQDVDTDLHRFTCPIRIKDDEVYVSNSALLPFIIGIVCGIVLISTIVTFFMLNRTRKTRKAFQENENQTHYIRSGSLGMETPA